MAEHPDRPHEVTPKAKTNKDNNGFEIHAILDKWRLLGEGLGESPQDSPDLFYWFPLFNFQYMYMHIKL